MKSVICHYVSLIKKRKSHCYSLRFLRKAPTKNTTVYMNNDNFVLSFDANNQVLLNVFQQNKDQFAFSEPDKNHELYNSINKKVFGEIKIETSTLLVLEIFTALRTKSYSFSSESTIVQKAKQ